MSTPLSLAQASIIVERALQAAREAKLNPLTVAVLDAGGHLLAFKREDGSGILRPEIAQGKAWGALGMGCGTRKLEERASAHTNFFTALASAAHGRIFPSAGGVLIKDSSGTVIGAVGISGDMPNQDEHCALHGIQAADLYGQVD